MPLLETDFELLETYLDGQLPMPEAEGLLQRLAADKELAATLTELRSERAMRTAVWNSMEPDDAAARLVSRRVSSAMRRQRVWSVVQRGLNYAVAAAACALVGFRVGWTAHTAPMGTSQQVAMHDNSPHNNVVQVAIRDQNGNLIGSPRFDTRQEAMDFVNALNATQTAALPSANPLLTPAAVPLERRDVGTNNVVPASDEQF